MAENGKFGIFGKVFDERKMAFWWQNPLEPGYKYSV